MRARVEDLTRDAQARAGSADPGGAFFAFLGRLGEEAATKRDLPDAISLPGGLLAGLHAAVDTLLRRAQAAGAVRSGVTVPELIIVLKGVLAAIGEAGEQGAGRDRAGRWCAILADGRRPPARGCARGGAEPAGRRHAAARRWRAAGGQERAEIT